MSARTPTTEQLIRPKTAAEWQRIAETLAASGTNWRDIANELAAEVTRLHDEIDRLQGGASKEPLASHADWTHPLYPLWIELGLDDLTGLVAAWHEVIEHRCPKCNGALVADVYVAPMVVCPDCQLCFEARDGHFAIDTVDRAMERGPDA